MQGRVGWVQVELGGGGGVGGREEIGGGGIHGVNVAVDWNH